MFNFKYTFNKLRDDIFYGEFKNQLRKGKVFPPYMVAWDCSRKCNLKCVHCGAVKEIYPQELTTEQIKKLIDELALIKVKFFGATGGEPLLREDLIEVLGYAVKKGIRTGFATNGFFIDKKLARKIKEAGIYSIQVSLDGTENIHNKIRRNNLSFQKAIEAIKNLQDENINLISVATTVTPMNFNNLNELKKTLLNLGIKRWRICVVMPIGRASKGHLGLNASQLKKLFNFIYLSRKEIDILVGENLPFLREFERKIRKSPLTCPVGFTVCCIGVDGNVRGCPEMPDTEKFIEGNILKTPFLEIWKNGFKKYRNREILKIDKRCASCKNKEECYGGCWVMREENVQCIYDLLK